MMSAQISLPVFFIVVIFSGATFAIGAESNERHPNHSARHPGHSARHPGHSASHPGHRRQNHIHRHKLATSKQGMYALFFEIDAWSLRPKACPLARLAFRFHRANRCAHAFARSTSLERYTSYARLPNCGMEDCTWQKNSILLPAPLEITFWASERSAKSPSSLGAKHSFWMTLYLTLSFKNQNGKHSIRGPLPLLKSPIRLFVAIPPSKSEALPKH